MCEQVVGGGVGARTLEQKDHVSKAETHEHSMFGDLQVFLLATA